MSTINGLNSSPSTSTPSVPQPEKQVSGVRKGIQSIWQGTCAVFGKCYQGSAKLTSGLVSYLDVREPEIKEHLGHTWEYVKHRNLLWGLPVAVASAAACAFLFKCPVSTLGLATPWTGAIFGTINYLFVTTLIELTSNIGGYSTEVQVAKATTIVGLSCLVVTAFMDTVLHVPLSRLWGVSLTIASFAGPLFRVAIDNEDSESYSYRDCPRNQLCTRNK